VLLDELLNAGVVRDGLVLTTIGFVSSCRSLNAAIVNIGPGNVGDFRLQEEGDILMKDGSSIGLALRKAGKVHGTDG
jgi:hypothetical protein